MTKQEEIKVGIERVLDELLFSPGESEDGYTYNLTGCITNLLNYLHSQGVVIKVDRKLPTTEELERLSKLSSDALAVRELFLNNSEAVMPLIKE